jgi:hypothetical protein
MIRLVLLVLLLASSRASADSEVLLRDFYVVRDRTHACIDAATTSAGAAACAGKALSQCLDPDGDWPYPAPRLCENEISVWTEIYRTELMVLLELANKLDMEELWNASTLFAQYMSLATNAEEAWLGYAGSICRVEGLVTAELTYDERQALQPTFCTERQFAERIFYLRSERNWLNDYRK